MYGMNAAFPFSLSLDMVRDTDDDIPRSAPAGAGARSSVSDAATAAAGSFRAATRAAPPCNAPVRRVVAGDDGDDAFTVKAMHVAVCGGYVRAVERNRGVAVYDVRTRYAYWFDRSGRGGCGGELMAFASRRVRSLYRSRSQRRRGEHGVRWYLDLGTNEETSRQTVHASMLGCPCIFSLFFPLTFLLHAYKMNP